MNENNSNNFWIKVEEFNMQEYRPTLIKIIEHLFLVFFFENDFACEYLPANKVIFEKGVQIIRYRNYTLEYHVIHDNPMAYVFTQD